MVLLGMLVVAVTIIAVYTRVNGTWAMLRILLT